MAITSNKVELADIFNLHLDDYARQYHVGRDSKKATRHIMACRTQALGGRVSLCNGCGHVEVRYHSCRNRHCPKCQTLTKERWLDARRAELLPVKYFHLVFTLPHDINFLALSNKKAVFGMLFHSVSRTLKLFAKDPKHKLGGEMGFVAILHTWDQKLSCHIHLHCMVPAIALLADQSGRVSGNQKYLFPVKALSLVFRGKFMEQLLRAFGNGKLTVPSTSQTEFKALIARLWSKNWVVYAKPPFKGPESVLEYIGRYTHRVALSNDRIVSLKDGEVTFAFRNRKSGKKESLKLEAVEFIRRFMLHILPSGFMKIRHYGFLANRAKKEKLGCLRMFLGLSHEPPERTVRSIGEMMLELCGKDITRCPACNKGILMHVAQIGINYRRAIPSARGRPIRAAG